MSWDTSTRPATAPPRTARRMGSATASGGRAAADAPNGRAPVARERSPSATRPPEDDVAAIHDLAALSARFADAEQRAVLAEARVRDLELVATRDPLTGVLNRRGWQHALAVAHARHERADAAFGVLVVDIDGLKRVNDTLGHAAGDRLLQAAARNLVAACREDDAVARLGGDEFAVLLELPRAEPPIDAAPALVDRLVAALRDAGVPVSVGWAGPDSGEPAAAELCADRHLVAAKAARPGSRPRADGARRLPAPPAVTEVNLARAQGVVMGWHRCPPGEALDRLAAMQPATDRLDQAVAAVLAAAADRLGPDDPNRVDHQVGRR